SMSSRGSTSCTSGRTTTRSSSPRASAPPSTRPPRRATDRRGEIRYGWACRGYAAGLFHSEVTCMAGIDESKSFVLLRIAVLTVFDTCSFDDDKSGATLVERIEKVGHAIAARAIVTDDVEKIRAQVKGWIADPAIDVVILTG